MKLTDKRRASIAWPVPSHGLLKNPASRAPSLCSSRATCRLLAMPGGWLLPALSRLQPVQGLWGKCLTAFNITGCCAKCGHSQTQFARCPHRYGRGPTRPGGFAQPLLCLAPRRPCRLAAFAARLKSVKVCGQLRSPQNHSTPNEKTTPLFGMRCKPKKSSCTASLKRMEGSCASRVRLAPSLQKCRLPLTRRGSKAMPRENQRLKNKAHRTKNKCVKISALGGSTR
jgi:hypothetical protein